MSIAYNAETRIFSLETAHQLYQMQVAEGGVLLHLYYGEKTGGDMSYLVRLAGRGFSGNPYEQRMNRGFSLDTLPQEYASSGVGDYRAPALRVLSENGSRSVDLRYAGHLISAGRKPIPGLPFVRPSEDTETLTVTLKDETLGLTVELLYHVFPAQDVLTRSVRITNAGSAPLTLEKAASFFDPEYTRKTCIACGAAIPMGARYCHLCGADQKWEGRYVPPSNPENDGEQPENKPESREGPAFRQRMLESAYLTMFDAPEGESVRELFPAGWYGACDETRILALSEAVSKRLRIEETNAWQKAEGTRS